MSLYQIAVEYVLVYCTSVGLTTLGEPSLAKYPQESDGASLPSSDGRHAMPVWMIFIFVFLAAAKWFISFLVTS